MQSLIQNLSTWHSSLAPIQKVGVAGVAITATLIGFRGISIAYKTYIDQSSSNNENNNNNNKDDEANQGRNLNEDGIDTSDIAHSSYLYRLKKVSFHPVFWGSFALTGLCWAFTLKPSMFDKLPRIYTFVKEKTLDQLLHPIPATMSQAFILGQLEKELTVYESKNDKHMIDNVLSQASHLLNSIKKYDETLTAKQLHSMQNEIAKSENSRSLANRAKRILNFVNGMWLTSILGISSTIVPVLYYTLKPFAELFQKFFGGYLQKLKKILLHPNAFRVHEAIGYFLCWYITVIADSGDASYGFYVALTGLCLFAPMLGLSFAIHDKKWSQDNDISTVALLTSLISSQLAYKYNSTLMGFTSIIGLYSYFGFFVCSFWGGYVIGFAGDESIGLCTISSLFFNILLILCKIYNVNMYNIRMFEIPLLIMSNIIYFLVLLIYSSEFRPYNRSISLKRDYWKRQITMITSLITAIFVGTYYDYPSMVNTSYVFGGLYILQKMGEIQELWSGKMVHYTKFGLSVVAWKLALYLHRNPKFLMGLLKFSGDE